MAKKFLEEHSEILDKRLRWQRGLVRDNREFQVVDDPVDCLIVCDENDDSHLAAAVGAEHGIDLINL